jgi:Subtilase family
MNSMRWIRKLPRQLLDLLRRIVRRDGGHEPDHGQVPGHHDRWPPLPPELGETTDTLGQGGAYVYVQGELLVGDGDWDATLERLRALYPNVRWNAADRVVLEELGLSILLLPDGAPPVPEIVDGLRYDERTSSLAVYPNHVLAWNSHAKFAPCGPPVWVDPNSPRAKQVDQDIAKVGPAAAAGPVRVGVLDTGVIRNSLPAGRCTFRDPADVDRPDRNNDNRLDLHAGHGTFVAGVILQHTVNATVTVRRLEPRQAPLDGYTTDDGLAEALRAWRLEPGFGQLRVLNLSIGGPTHNGAGLPATRAALDLCRQVTPDLVIVAGAGNDNTNQPFFPAAFNDVVGVAAIRDTVPDQRACFSNLGTWVRACAPGTGVVSAFLQWRNNPMAQYPAPPAACLGQVPPSPAGNVRFDMVAEWRGTSFAAPVVAAWIANRMATGNVTGAQADNDLRNGGLAGLGQVLTDLGRVVRPPF